MEYSSIRKIRHNINLYLKIIRKRRSSLAGFIIILIYIFMATIGPILVPFDRTPNVSQRFRPPSWEHPLGTDYAGRDIFAQIIHGSRDVLLVAFLTGIFTVIFGLTVGIISGYAGGKIDTALNTATNMLLIIPHFPLLLIIAASIPRVMSPVEVAFIIGIIGWAGLARAIRSQVLSIKEANFIEAARCLGLGRLHIVFKEIMPNLMPYIAMNLVLSIISGIYSQVGLFFLGVMPYTSVNWGMMINIAMRQQAVITPKLWLYLFSPIVAIITLETGFILFLHALEEIFNPRLREE